MENRTRKSCILIILLISCILLFTGCGCEHEWKEADCDSPKMCKVCGEIEGERLEHIWQEATCTSPKKCTNCGATVDEALPHTWEEASCESAQKCTVCGVTEGAALGHSWIDATYSAPKTCLCCGLTEGDVRKVHDGNVFTMTIDEFNSVYNAQLSYYYGYSFLPRMQRSLDSLIIDIENIQAQTEDDPTEDYSEVFDLMGTYMTIHCYADKDSKNISRMVFELDENDAKEHREEIAEDLNDYIVNGLIAYSVINPQISFMEAAEFYKSSTDTTEGRYTFSSFTNDGVTFKSTVAYCYFKMEIYIEG